MSAGTAASVKARLLNGAKARGEEFELTLSRFAAERLLYRLGQSSARDQCILKGAGLLSVWLSDPYRATRDIDLLASGSQDDKTIRKTLETICAVSYLEDGLEFDLTELTITVIRPEEEYSGKRARFSAALGSARILVQVDFGFGDALTTAPDDVEYPTLLPDLPRPHIQAYPRVATVAEKFEAMVKLETRNSRMKDFHDIWALSGAFPFDGGELREAIAACFDRRRTEWTTAMPAVLTGGFYLQPDLQQRWSGYVRRGAMRAAPPMRFEEIGERIRHFLLPVRDSIANGAPLVARWIPGGPWQ